MDIKFVKCNSLKKTESLDQHNLKSLFWTFCNCVSPKGKKLKHVKYLFWAPYLCRHEI